MSDTVEPRWTGAYEPVELGARYDALVRETAPLSPHFERGFRNRLFVLDGGGWISITDLEDDFHQMRVALKIAADGEIVEAAGRMERNPYETCPRAIEALRDLVGANVARPSAHNQIKLRMPRTEGCLHIADMLTIAFRGFRIAKGHDMTPQYAGEESRRALLNVLPNMRDTCLSFAVEPDA